MSTETQSVTSQDTAEVPQELLDQQQEAPTDFNVEQATQEAIEPAKSKDKVTLTGLDDGKTYDIPIRFLPVEREERLMEAADPLLKSLEGVQGFDGLIALFKQCMVDLPSVVAIICEPLGLDRAMIVKNFSTADLMDISIEQMIKFREQDLLGKLSRLRGR